MATYLYTLILLYTINHIVMYYSISFANIQNITNNIMHATYMFNNVMGTCDNNYCMHVYYSIRRRNSGPDEEPTCGSVRLINLIYLLLLPYCTLFAFSIGRCVFLPFLHVRLQHWSWVLLPWWELPRQRWGLLPQTKCDFIRYKCIVQMVSSNIT